MEAKELRIGNIVTVNNPEYHPKLLNTPLVISGISPALNPIDRKPTFSISLENVNPEPNTFYENCSQFIKYIEPIKLTEEILLNFGFVKEECAFVDSKISPIRLLYSISNNGYCVKAVQYPLTFVKHLHQLQNLYFALTGEELEYK